jgi:hypothetical protein
VTVGEHDPDGLCLQSSASASACYRGLGWGSASVVSVIERVAHGYQQMEGATPTLAHQ